ncbi:MAG: UDP-N-acetylmuramoyl-tripeptide--D-alanyl-D-alanine ligase [Croceimicrobium sp.]
MDISNLYDLFISSEGICTDTRKLLPGQLYFALKGDNFNGNLFADKALEMGAAAAIVDEAKYEGPGKLLVANALKALQDLALFHRQQLSIPVIGLTGSNGKTTSKELLVSVLQQKFNVAYTAGNLNNHIGVPLSLLSINSEAEIAVIEMGANAQKEIEFLSAISLPDIGFITNYGKAHLEGFGGPEGVIKGKSELYENLRKRGKLAWVNCNDPLQIEKSSGIEQKLFGADEAADYPVFPVNEMSTFVKVKWQDLIISSKLTGAYNYTNIAIAISLGAYFGLSPAQVKAGIENYQPSNNRSQMEEGQRNLLVKDYYNANPSSMEAALKNFDGLKEQANAEKWVILGDMFELGAYEEDEHQRIADQALASGYQKTILVGKAFAKTEGASEKFESTADLISWLETHQPKGKLILVKGSRGMTLEKAAELL